MAGCAPDMRIRVSKLRRLASEFRRISKEYAALDQILAERLRALILDLEQEAAELEDATRRPDIDDSSRR